MISMSSRKLTSITLKSLPFLILGCIIFSFNSTLELPYFVKGYLSLIEAQTGLLLFYFLFRKNLVKKNQEH